MTEFFNPQVLFNSLAYSILGIAVFWISFLVIDKFTPYHLWNELVEKRNQPLAIERFASSGGEVFAPASARPGQSYVGATRGRMHDLTASIPRANVCLKAFAR